MSQTSRHNNICPPPRPSHRARREALLGQRGCVVWLTGLSASGKSTVAGELEVRLLGEGRLCYVLDGDAVRGGLNSDLGFSPADRDENIRRVGHVAALLADAGLIVIAAFISPYRHGRALARSAVPDGRFVEVFCDTPLDICRRRDPKGLYRKAQAGQIEQFTGIDAPYEPPDSCELVLQTGAASLAECVDAVYDYLASHKLLSASMSGKAPRK